MVECNAPSAEVDAEGNVVPDLEDVSELSYHLIARVNEPSAVKFVFHLDWLPAYHRSIGSGAFVACPSFSS